MIKICGALIAGLVLAGCVSTKAPRYLIVRDHYQLTTPASLPLAVAELPGSIEGSAMYPSGAEQALVPKGTQVRHIEDCRIVDRKTGYWSQVHCDAANVLVGPEVDVTDRQRTWKQPGKVRSPAVASLPKACETAP